MVSHPRTPLERWVLRIRLYILTPYWGFLGGFLGFPLLQLGIWLLLSLPLTALDSLRPADMTIVNLGLFLLTFGFQIAGFALAVRQWLHKARGFAFGLFLSTALITLGDLAAFAIWIQCPECPL